MNKVLSAVLLIAGMVLIGLSLRHADSWVAGLAQFFTGSPTEKTTWFMIVGLFAIAVGLVGVLRGSKA